MGIYAPPNTVNGQTASVVTLQTTTSTTFTDLATVGPTVTVNIGGSGLALVILSGGLSSNTVGAYAVMGFAASGANTIAATFNNSLAVQVSATSNNEIESSYSLMLSGLTAGSTTFTAKYEVINASTGTFRFRNIAVIPL